MAVVVESKSNASTVPSQTKHEKRSKERHSGRDDMAFGLCRRSDGRQARYPGYKSETETCKTGLNHVVGVSWVDERVMNLSLNIETGRSRLDRRSDSSDFSSCWSR